MAKSSSSDIEKCENEGGVNVHAAEHMSKNDAVTRILAVNHQHGGAEKVEYISDLTAAGEAKFHKLGWQQLVVVLIVTAVALGTLSMPVVFMLLGMVGGVLATIGMGILAIYASYVIGQVKVKYPQVHHYCDIGPLLCGPGRAGRWVQNFLRGVFILFLTLIVGSHCLTGTIALRTITQSNICNVVWGIISMIMLFICALPPSFAEMAFLGYVDFSSLMVAVLITLIATGINASKAGWDIDWRATHMEGLTFADGILALTNVLFAYSFAICQFTFMEEMHTPADFPKSVIALGSIQIVIYTLVGALGYAFIGSTVQAPALLSAGKTVSRVAFGVALPVIFISGSICVVTAGRFMMDLWFPHSTVRYVNTARGWMVWIAMITGVVLIGWVIAQAIPIFNPLLGIISALFNSAFSLYLPGLMWFMVIKEGGVFSSPKNILLSVINMSLILVGLVIFGAGTYGSVMDMKSTFDKGKVGKPFGCS